jgi:hypothetical protein
VGAMRHVAAPNLAGLGEACNSAVVDLVFMLGLSRYLGVPLPCGTVRYYFHLEKLLI